jgi:hypothetical protein
MRFLLKEKVQNLMLDNLQHLQLHHLQLHHLRQLLNNLL